MDAINFQSAVARMQQASAARAYSKAGDTQTRSSASAPVAPYGRGGDAVALDSRALDSTAQAARTRIISQLVGATVPGGVEFAANAPQTSQRQSAPSQRVLAMYRHPADKNIAATNVYSNVYPNGIAGRSIDVEG